MDLKHILSFSLKIIIIPPSERIVLPIGTIKAALTPIQFMGNILLPGSPFGKDNSFLRSDGYLKKRSDEMEKLNEWRNYKSSNPEHYVCDQYRLNYNLGKRLKIKEK
tara:strand:+ start:329 stop:649 length:321 start_codon:yes stop_codon:yes gene_type:complete